MTPFFFLLFFLPHSSGSEIFHELDKFEYKVHKLSCIVGLCVVAEGCDGNQYWRRVLEWPDWKGNLTNCKHAFMIRKNVDPGMKDRMGDDIIKSLNRHGEEYLVVMGSGGNTPAREMRLEDKYLRPIVGVTHEGYKRYDELEMKKRKNGLVWTIESYEYQKVTDNLFEAGILIRIKNAKNTGKEEDKDTGNEVYDVWEDLCVFIHSSRSTQHLCGGLERVFQRIPSKKFPMKQEECGDTFDASLVSDSEETGFFKCKGPDIALKVKDAEIGKKMKYVRLHYAFCRMGKTLYLVEHRNKGFMALEYKTAQQGVVCGDVNNEMEKRCTAPEIPKDVFEYCGVRCEQSGMTTETINGETKHVVKCDFLNTVVDGKVYYRKEKVPLVYCDWTGWWRSTDPLGTKNGRGTSKWIDSIYCFYPQSDVYSDCVLDRFECSRYGECPKHRQHQVDCDGNKKGLKLAVFHDGLKYGYTQVDHLGCDKKNGWWQVGKKSLPKTAQVACVYPMELEILKRAATIKSWDPKPVQARAISAIGSSVRTTSLVVAIVAILVVAGGIIIVKTRLQGPKTRMITRKFRALYPSLLNETERLDADKAEKEYKSADCEAAGLALHQLYKRLEGENRSTNMLLHEYWISLSWPKQNLLMERTILHRAFYTLKVLYDKLKVSPSEGEHAFEQMRPGLRERILEVVNEYKEFSDNWTTEEYIYSLAFSTLSKAELDAFRRNQVERKVLRPKPRKEQSVITVLATSAPGTDKSNKKTGVMDTTTGVTTTAIAPTVDETATGGSTGKGGDKIEETTAPPPDKE